MRNKPHLSHLTLPPGGFRLNSVQPADVMAFDSSELCGRTRNHIELDLPYCTETLIGSVNANIPGTIASLPVLEEIRREESV
jgi:hypothetical protein